MGNSKNKVRLSKQLKLGVGRSYSKNTIFKYTGFVFLFLSIGLGVWTTAYVLSHRNTSPAIVENSDAAGPQVLGISDTQPSSQPFIEYTVAKGDTIFNIAQNHSISWTTLATLNNLASPFTLKVGQKIKIPQQ
jgi:hypothetical protein